MPAHRAPLLRSRPRTEDEAPPQGRQPSEVPRLHRRCADPGRRRGDGPPDGVRGHHLRRPERVRRGDPLAAADARVLRVRGQLPRRVPPDQPPAQGGCREGRHRVLALPRSDNGQGIQTLFAMIIAEEMGIEPEQVKVTLADARPELVFNQLTGGSSSTYSPYTPSGSRRRSPRAVCSTPPRRSWARTERPVEPRAGSSPERRGAGVRRADQEGLRPGHAGRRRRAQGA